MIEFFSSVKGLAETHPIYPTKNFTPNWVKQSRSDFQKQEEKNAPHLALCPGINDVQRSGFIVPAWCDFDIMSSEEGLQARFPPDLEDVFGGKVIQVQSGDSLAKFLPKRPWSNKDIIKINTPWHIKSKVKLLMIPIPYNDDLSLESTIGILDPDISNVINIQSYVNGFGVLSIKAGTPLCQLIPISDEEHKLIVRDANKKDIEFLEKSKYVNNLSFRLNRKAFKNLYRKFIGSGCPFHK
jgi:hypothetical protein